MIPKKAIRTRLRLSQRPNASRSGAVQTSPSSLSFAKAGLSDSLKRSQTEMISSTTETRNGMRQPHSRKASSPTDLRVPRMTSSPAIRPSEAVIWIQPVVSPRRLFSACSAT